MSLELAARRAIGNRFGRELLKMSKINSYKFLSLTLTAPFLIGCISQDISKQSNFTELVTQEGEVSLTGWVRLQGEVMLYSDQESLMNEERFPKCISGVFRNHDPDKIEHLNGKPVVVKGSVTNYANLPEENIPILARKTLAGSVIPNFCFGENVLLIESIS